MKSLPQMNFKGSFIKFANLSSISTSFIDVNKYTGISEGIDYPLTIHYFRHLSKNSFVIVSNICGYLLCAS